MNRRALLSLLGGTAALALAPAPLRTYFIIGQPERRLLSREEVWTLFVSTPLLSLNPRVKASFGELVRVYPATAMNAINCGLLRLELEESAERPGLARLKLLTRSGIKAHEAIAAASALGDLQLSYVIEQ